jgi:hypothetical protein
VPISVHAQVALADPTRAAEVEEDLRRRLDTFLHPLKGGAFGTGWQFGQPVHLSQVAQIVRETPGVDYALQVQLTSGGIVFGDSVTVDPMRLAAAGQHVLKLELES